MPPPEWRGGGGLLLDGRRGRSLFSVRLRQGVPVRRLSELVEPPGEGRSLSRASIKYVSKIWEFFKPPLYELAVDLCYKI